MNTLVINGSPKGRDSNTDIFIAQFFLGAGKDYEVRYAACEEPRELAAYLYGFDAVLFFMPMYVFAMPGIVMRLFENMKPRAGQRLGFVLQYGFVEGNQADYAKRVFEAFTARMRGVYLGTASRGNAAGVSMMPARMSKPLFSLLRALGAHYETTGTFDAAVAAKLLEPYAFTKRRARWMDFLFRIGLEKIMWHFMLRSNNALDKVLDRPFAEGEGSL